MQSLMTLEKCSKIAKILQNFFIKITKMLLKHLMKVFNALRNYLVESIGVVYKLSPNDHPK